MKYIKPTIFVLISLFISQLMIAQKPKVIHILVALCDNKYQGIVPVPPKIGNGQDLDNNLYWGCGFGIRTYFSKSKEWTLLKKEKLSDFRLERLIFKNKKHNAYLIADAYNGKYIKECTLDFLRSNALLKNEKIKINSENFTCFGGADLLVYIGHDGLMDFDIDETYNIKTKKDIMILACYSKKYFKPYLDAKNTNPIIWTSGLMCPEAYTVHDAITGYLLNESNENIQKRAAKAYSKYLKCSFGAAKNLLLTGW